MDSGGDDGRLRGDGQRPALLPGMRRVFDGLGAFKRRSLLLTAGILAECLEGSVLLLRESAALLQQRLGRLLCSSCQGSGVLGPGRRAERAWLLCVCYAKNASRWLRDLFRGSAPTSQPMTPPAVVAPAAGTPPATSLAPAAGPSKEAPMPSLGPNSGSPSARPVPPPPPIPDSSHQTPKPSAMPSSVSPGNLPTPPDEAFRGVGQPWLR